MSPGEVPIGSGAAATMSERIVLRPRLPRRLVTLAVGLALLAGGIASLVAAGSVAAVVISLVLLVAGGWIAAIGAGRLLAPGAYTTVIDRHGIVTRGSFGRVVHDVPWTELDELQPIAAGTAWGPLSEPLVGFRCRPRRGWRPGVIGRLTRPMLADVDGVLPDPYRGLDETMRTITEAVALAGLAEHTLTVRGWLPRG